MSVETLKELDDFFRSMRQAYNARDMKSYRSHCWTDKRFVHLDVSGRVDSGWGTYEEMLDQEFRYLDKITLDFKDLQIHAASDRFAVASGGWKLVQVDPDGRTVEREGRVSFAAARMRDDWKVVQQHFSADATEEI